MAFPPNAQVSTDDEKARRRRELEAKAARILGGAPSADSGVSPSGFPMNRDAMRRQELEAKASRILAAQSAPAGPAPTAPANPRFAEMERVLASPVAPLDPGPSADAMMRGEVAAARQAAPAVTLAPIPQAPETPADGLTPQRRDTLALDRLVRDQYAQYQAGQITRESYLDTAARVGAHLRESGALDAGQEGGQSWLAYTDKVGELDGQNEARAAALAVAQKEAAEEAELQAAQDAAGFGGRLENAARNAFKGAARMGTAVQRYGASVLDDGYMSGLMPTVVNRFLPGAGTLLEGAEDVIRDRTGLGDRAEELAAEARAQADSADAWIDRTANTDPVLDRGFDSKLGGAVGSAGAFMAASALSRGQASRYLVPALLGGATNAGNLDQELEQRIASGDTTEEAAARARSGAFAVGTLEGVPYGNLFRRMQQADRATGGAVTRYLGGIAKESGEEFAQEGLNGILTDAVMRAEVDPDRAFDLHFEDALLGAVAGAGTAVVMNPGGAVDAAREVRGAVGDARARLLPGTPRREAESDTQAAPAAEAAAPRDEGGEVPPPSPVEDAPTASPRPSTATDAAREEVERLAAALIDRAPTEEQLGDALLRPEIDAAQNATQAEREATEPPSALTDEDRAAIAEIEALEADPEAATPPGYADRLIPLVHERAARRVAEAVAARRRDKADRVRALVGSVDPDGEVSAEILAGLDTPMESDATAADEATPTAPPVAVPTPNMGDGAAPALPDVADLMLSPSMPSAVAGDGAATSAPAVPAVEPAEAPDASTVTATATSDAPAPAPQTPAAINEPPTPGAVRRETGRYERDGIAFERQPDLTADGRMAVGEPTEVQFGEAEFAGARWAVVEAADLQPSHREGRPNPIHFLPEAQPKNRADDAQGRVQSRRIAGDLRPDLVTDGATAYSGAPVVNGRGEVLQGNGRADALRIYNIADGDPNGYRDAVRARAEAGGIDPATVDAMQAPVLVRLATDAEGAPVSDEAAIRLGQFGEADISATDTAATRAKQLAGRVSPEGAGRLAAVMDDALETLGRDATLAAVLRRRGGAVARILADEGAGQAGRLLDGSTLTSEGRETVRAVLLARMLGGGDRVEAFERLPYVFRLGVEKSLPSLLALPEGARLGDALGRAAEARDAFEATGSGDFAAWSAQADLFDGRTPADVFGADAMTLLRVARETTKEAEARGALARYAQEVTGPQPTMFDPAPEPIAPALAFARAFGGDGDVRLSVEAAGEAAPLTDADRAQIEAFAEAATRELGPVAVVASLSDLPPSARVVAEGASGPDTAVPALYTPDGSFVVLSEVARAAAGRGLTPVQAARGAVYHETLAHLGLRGALGDARTNDLLDAVWRAVGPRKVRELGLIERYRSRLSLDGGRLTVDDKRLLAEEVLGHSAARLRTLNPSMLSRIRAALRRAFDRLLGRVGDAEIEALLHGVARYLRASRADGAPVESGVSRVSLAAPRVAEVAATPPGDVEAARWRAAEALAETVDDAPALLVLRGLDGDTLSDGERAALVLRLRDLHEERDAALEQAVAHAADGNRASARHAAARAEALAGEVGRVTRAVEGGGAHDADGVRRLDLDGRGYALATVLSEAAAAKGGTLSAEETAALTEAVEAAQEAAATVARLEAAAVGAHETQAEAVLARVPRRERTQAGIEKARADRAAILQEMRESAGRLYDVTGAAVHGASLLRRLAMTYVREGAYTLAEVVARVRQDAPWASREDVARAIAGDAKAPTAARRDLAQAYAERSRRRARVREAQRAVSGDDGGGLIDGLINLPRTLVASGDISGLGNQAAPLIRRHPILAARALWWSIANVREGDAEAASAALRLDPGHYLREAAGLYIAPVGSEADVAEFSEREESFRSRLAEKAGWIWRAGAGAAAGTVAFGPGVGTAVGAAGGLAAKSVTSLSGHQFALLLNGMRAAAFDRYAEANPEATMEDLRGVARSINLSTGRGELGRAEPLSGVAALLLFSPRLTAARFQLPWSVVRKASGPAERAYAARTLASMIGVNMFILAALDLSFGDDEENRIGWDPRESDFGRIVIGGRTRVDIHGGYAQNARLLARMLLTATDAHGVTERPAGAREIDPKAEIGRYANAKKAPHLQLLLTMMTGDDFMGRRTTVAETVQDSSIPISWNEAAETWRDETLDSPRLTAAAVFALNSIGVGTSVYEGRAADGPHRSLFETAGYTPPGVSAGSHGLPDDLTRDEEDALDTAFQTELEGLVEGDAGRLESLNPERLKSALQGLARRARRRAANGFEREE